MGQDRDLTNRVICITGASAGIGRATALACARAGMDVVVSARREDRLVEVAMEIGKIGRRALAVVADVGDDESVNRLIERSHQHFGRLDAVLANAGYGIEGNELDLSDETVRQIFEVNFFGSLRVMRAAIPIFREQGHGHLLMTSSCLARFPLPYYGHYAATKAAQSQIGLALRLELRPENIHVSTVYPITTVTEFFDVVAEQSQLPKGGILDHAPKFFVQPADRVADAIVKCLRRPRAEVWTSQIVRLSAGLMNVWPWLYDRVMRNQAARRRLVLTEPAVHDQDNSQETSFSPTSPGAPAATVSSSGEPTVGTDETENSAVISSRLS
ncbi:MAG: SDR family NAD(P)-dependent oxidoreductase [Planctomycetota bacterium]